MSTAIIHRSLVWYRLDYHSISLDFILISFPFISPFSRNLYSRLTHGFSAHATLPDVFRCQIRGMMIGHLNANLLACQSYIYLYRLYGRTVAHHVRGSLGGMDDVFGGIDDTLRQIARIAYDPLCACPACEKQAQADNHCYSCSHVTLDFSGCYSSVGCPGCGFTRT